MTIATAITYLRRSGYPVFRSEGGHRLMLGKAAALHVNHRELVAFARLMGAGR